MNNKQKNRFVRCLAVASKVVRFYRNQAPIGFDPVCQAYGQTDVMHNRDYLIGRLSDLNPRVREQARIALEDMRAREAQETQIQATRENLAEARAARQQQFETSQASIAQRAKELADYRGDLLTQRQGEEANQHAARLLAALPEIQVNFPGAQGQAISQQILNQFLAQHGISLPTGAAPDATTNAVRQFAQSQGKATVPAAAPATTPATTTAPVSTAAAAPAAATRAPAVTGGAAPATAATTPATAAVLNAPNAPAAPLDLGPTPPQNWLATAKRVVNPDGSVTTTLPSGGTATAFDRTTPEGVAAINMARKESARLSGQPFSPVSLVASGRGGNIPTNEDMTPLGPGEGAKLAPGSLAEKPATTPTTAAATPIGPTPAGPPIGAPGAGAGGSAATPYEALGPAIANVYNKVAESYVPGGGNALAPLNTRAGAAGEAISSVTKPIESAATAPVAAAANFLNPMKQIAPLFSGPGGGANQIVQPNQPNPQDEELKRRLATQTQPQ